MFQLTRVLLLALPLVLVACGADTPTSRIEAYKWLSNNWKIAEPHAWRLVELCAKQDGDIETAGIGTSSLPPDEEEEIRHELRASNATFVTCQSQEVRLDVGAGAEDHIDFYAAYFYLPSVVVEEPPCTEDAFVQPGGGACMTRLDDDWYIGIHWFPR